MTHTSRYEGCELIDATGGDPDHVVPQQPMVIDGCLYLPARASAVARVNGPKITAVTISMKVNDQAGIHAAMSPATARIYAAALVRIADEIEREAADVAEAYLNKAAGK